MRRAFITGITGQDGSYLAELLLGLGYEVHGLVHRPDRLSSGPLGAVVRQPGILGKRLLLHNGTFEDATHLRRLLVRARPDELYHLAGQSSPRLSLEVPEATVESIGMATLRLLEILRDLDQPPRLLYASSSEVFGSPPHSPQDEFTPLQPATPYGVAKAFAQQMMRIYRQSYGLPCCAAILYNHESPRRSEAFVTMKIARAAARIRRGLQQELVLGSLEGRRDWGWAPDYVAGMHRMLQQDPVDDFVLATGITHSVRDFVAFAFAAAGLDWEAHVRYDPGLVTAMEPVALCGNPERARRLLGWSNSVPLREIAARMVEVEGARLDGTPLPPWS